MDYLLFALWLGAIAYSIKRIGDFVRAVRYLQWKSRRDNLTLSQFVQSLESEYYKAKIKELYKND